MDNIKRTTVLKIIGQSDIGKKREVNEDNFLIGNIVENIGRISIEIPIESAFVKNHGLILAVADGMGGYNAGEVASALALKTLSSELIFNMKSMVSNSEVVDLVRNSVVSANNAICEMSSKFPEYTGMGTTLSGLYFIRENLFTFHAGDSRVYRLRHGGLLQLTKDHSLVQNLIDMQQITKEESYMHPQKNVITNSLGGGTGKCEPDITDKYGFFDDDIFLICSDGLPNMVHEEMIEKILSDNILLELKVDKLIASANDQGGEDNITVMLISVANDLQKNK